MIQEIIARTKFIKSDSSAYKSSSFNDGMQLSKVEDIDIGGYRWYLTIRNEKGW